MASAATSSLRWLTEHMVGVPIGTARSQRVLSRFLDRAMGEGAEVVHSDNRAIAIQWPDGTWLSMEGLALWMTSWPARGWVH